MAVCRDGIGSSNGVVIFANMRITRWTCRSPRGIRQFVGGEFGERRKGLLHMHPRGWGASVRRQTCNNPDHDVIRQLNNYTTSWDDRSVDC